MSSDPHRPHTTRGSRVEVTPQDSQRSVIAPFGSVPARTRSSLPHAGQVGSATTRTVRRESAARDRGTNLTVPPRCYPPDPQFGEERRAERTVWEALREQLPEEAVLFHSVALKERDQDYEADLVVAWPGVGIGVVEVKGGRITHEDGQWWQGDREGRHRINPVEQAQDCVHVLPRSRQQRPTPAANARSTYLVAFPHTDVPGTWELPGCPRGLVIDKGDLVKAAEIVRSAIDVYGT